MGTITPNGTPLNVQIYAIFLKDRAFTLFLLKDSRFARTCTPPFVCTFALVPEHAADGLANTWQHGQPSPIFTA